MLESILDRDARQPRKTGSDRLEAGYDLNRLVHEKVLGHKILSWAIPVYEASDRIEPCEILRGTLSVPRYSASIAAAWEIVEKLDLHVGPFEHIADGVVKSWYASECHDWDETKAVAVAKAVPLAVCRCALTIDE